MGDPVTATDLGISLVETMQEYCPEIISTELTRETEGELQAIEEGKSDGIEMTERAITILLKQIEVLRSNGTVVGDEIQQAAVQSTNLFDVLGMCPVCKSGKLPRHKVQKDRQEVRGLYGLLWWLQGFGTTASERVNQGCSQTVCQVWVARRVRPAREISMEAVRELGLREQGWDKKCDANSAEGKVKTVRSCAGTIGRQRRP